MTPDKRLHPPRRDSQTPRFVEEKSGKRRDYRTLLGDLRRQIVEGKWPPGTSLPTRQALISHYGTSNFTLQRAMDELKRDGFIQARRKAGTFVAEKLPHLRQIGLVFSDKPDRTYLQSSFLAALLQCAMTSSFQQAFHVQAYHDVRADHPDGDYRKLMDDIHAQKLAGLVLTNPWANRPLLPSLTTLPCVSFDHQSLNENYLEGGPWLTVDLDMVAFFRMALEHMASENRRRVGVLLCDSVDARFPAAIYEIASSLGVEVRPEWVLAVNAARPVWTDNAVRSLASDGHALDGLIVADDSLVPAATTALAHMNIRLPEDWRVICHCNYPLYPQYMVRPIFLGFTVMQVLSLCFQLICRARTGAEGSSVTRIEPEYESAIINPVSQAPSQSFAANRSEIGPSNRPSNR